MWYNPPPAYSVAGSEEAHLEELQNNPTFQEELKKLKKKRAEANKTGTAAAKVVKDEVAAWKAAIQDALALIRSSRDTSLSSIKNNPAMKEHKSRLTSYKTAFSAFKERWGLYHRTLRSLLPNWGHVAGSYHRSLKLRYFSLRSV